MRLDVYRKILAIPGFRSLMVAAFLIRIPVSAVGMAFTFYVVQDLHRGYGAAGIVVTASTIGTTLGAPFLGRLIDRKGLRTVLLITTIGEAALWFVAPALSFAALIPFVTVVCVIRLPIYSITKQAIAAMVPADQRRQAFALDSMTVELSFMVGPALATVMVTQYSGRATLIAIGVAMMLACAALATLNPPVTPGTPATPTATTTPDGQEIPPPTGGQKTSGGPARGRRTWLSAAMIIQFAFAGAALIALSGSDVAIVATLRAADQVEWTGFVFAVWCAASLTGAFVFGMIKRPVSPALLIGALAVLTVPVGLGTQWWLLAITIIPAGLFCAPALTASSDAVTRLAPPDAVGEVFGWHGAATTIGVSLGAPLAGAVIDRTNPAMGFVAVGGVGIIVVLVALAVEHWQQHVAPGRAGEPSRAPRCGVRATPRAELAGLAGDSCSTAGTGALEPELR